MKPTLLLLLALGGGARADEAGDIVSKARALMERKPNGVVCALEVESRVTDGKGKLEHTEQRRGKATLRGDDEDVDTASVVRDGKPMSPEELQVERERIKNDRKKRKKGDEDFELSPLAPKNAPSEEFTLLRRETLWGRPAVVLAVRARANKPTLANGTLWIDAETFVELKGELTPATNPEHVDWLKLQEQYALGPGGVTVPSVLYVEGAGHFLFVKKQFRTTIRWSDCR